MKKIESQRNKIKQLLLMEMSWQMWKTEKKYISSQQVLTFLSKLFAAKKIPVSQQTLDQIIHDSSCYQINQDGNIFFIDHYFMAYFLARRLYLTLCKQKIKSIYRLFRTRLYENNILYYLAMLDQKSNRINPPLQHILQDDYMDKITENALHIYYTTSQFKRNFQGNAVIENNKKIKNPNVTQFNVTQNLDFSLEFNNNTFNASGASPYTDKEKAKIFFKQGLALLKENKYFEAMAPFFTAKSLDPDCFKAYNNLAIIFKNLGSVSIAKKIVQNVLLEEPDNNRAKDHLRILNIFERQLT
jgi:tetratricopeptide (TPR) repeat protein